MIKWTGNNKAEIDEYIKPYTSQVIGNITGRGKNILAIGWSTISKNPGIMKCSGSIEIPEGDFVLMGMGGPQRIKSS